MGTNSNSPANSEQNDPSACAECERLKSVNADLLAAAKRAFEKFKDSTCRFRLRPSIGSDGILPECECFICQLAAAIAKAEGGSSIANVVEGAEGDGCGPLTDDDREYLEKKRNAELLK